MIGTILALSDTEPVGLDEGLWISAGAKKTIMVGDTGIEPVASSV